MLRPYQNIVRRVSRVVNVGNVKIGGTNPIAVQTMTNTLTSLSIITKILPPFPAVML